MIIEGTQYHRPNGRSETVSGVIRDDLQSQWWSLTNAGLRLEMEVLPDGGVSLTLTDPERGDYATYVVRNIDDHPRKAVEEMVEAFDLASLTAWREEWDRVETEVINDPDAMDKPLLVWDSMNETDLEAFNRLVGEAMEASLAGLTVVERREIGVETSAETAETAETVGETETDDHA